MSIKITDSYKSVDLKSVSDILRSTPIRKNISQSEVETAFLNSAYTLFALDGSKAVGLARTLSDNIEWTLITDLFVLPEYRGQSIGKSLINGLLEKYKGHELFGFTDPGSIPFFEKHGFNRSKNSFTYAGYEPLKEGSILSDKKYFLPLGYKYENEFGEVVGSFPVGKKGSIAPENVDLRFSKELTNIDYNRLNEILSDAFGGKKRDIEVTKKAFRGSRFVSFAFDGEKLIGCARAESDGVTQGFILNVAVDPSYQGIHLGREVVSRLAAQMEGENIFLNTHPGGVGFYNRKGFVRNKTAVLYPAHPVMPPEIERGFVLPRGYRFADEI